MSLPTIEALAVLGMSAFLIYQARRLPRALPKSPRPVSYGLAAAGFSGLFWKGGFLLQGIPGAPQASDSGEATVAIITTVVILLLMLGCWRMSKSASPEPVRGKGKSDVRR